MKKINTTIILTLSWLVSGCATTKVLKEAALTDCGTSTVYLSAWYTLVPDPSVINADPLGGYQFVYWVDNAGNACHGDPGRNGQVGPAVINAYTPWTHQAAAHQVSISDAQLKAAQEIPVPYGHYAGSGLHFVQFNNTINRSRTNGQVSQVDSAGVISIPTVMDIGSNACVAPVALHVINTLFLPTFPPTVSQDPHRCQVRAQPTGAALSEDDLKKYDIFNLPHGMEIFDVR